MNLKAIIEPSAPQSPRVVSFAVPLLLAISASCLITASLIMPVGYSWRVNVISESAAQGMSYAWVARLGFLLFGFAVIWLAAFLRPIWARGTFLSHLFFGIFMVGTAAFSHKPWLPNIPYDQFEDFLHSVTATGMGFAFALGVVARFVQRNKSEKLSKAFDIAAIAAATFLSPLGEIMPAVAGVLQRAMFLVAYLWFGMEAIYGMRLPSPRA